MYRWKISFIFNCLNIGIIFAILIIRNIVIASIFQFCSYISVCKIITWFWNQWGTFSPSVWPEDSLLAEVPPHPTNIARLIITIRTITSFLIWLLLSNMKWCSNTSTLCFHKSNTLLFYFTWYKPYSYLSLTTPSTMYILKFHQWVKRYKNDWKNFIKIISL